MKISTRIVTVFTALGLIVAVAGRGRAGQIIADPVDARATDANITRLTTELFGRSQFSHHPLDAELAGRLLDRYVDALDGARSLFLQSDIDEFATFRANLARATLTNGDTTAEHAIFARYLRRLTQQVSYVREALRTTKLEFVGHDVYSFDRLHARRPADVGAARELWRQQLRAEYLEEKLADKPSGKIASTLLQRREQQLRTMEGLRDGEILETYLDALAHVYDPHSDYLGHEEMENLSIAMQLSLFGIGASLESEDGFCKIHELLPGGPAARSGVMKEGERIIAVAQAGKDPVDIVNMPLSRAVDLIRGPKGSRLTLTVVAGTDGDTALPRTVSLVRDEIKLADQEAKARIIDLPTDKGDGTTTRLGVIDLPSFYAGSDDGSVADRRSATVDVARLLEKLKAEHVQGIVMDLRHNGGGSLDEAIKLTGLFIDKGPVVQTRDPDGRVDVGEDDDGKVFYDGPLVLLTSRFSASATEIMVGALQDYGRGVVVGDSSTFGKGTVQSILALAPVMDRAGLAHAYDPGALKVTVSKFYRPSGASTQLRGVASDIVLPSTTDLADVSESTLKDPLPWDVVPSKTYEHLNRVGPYLDALRDRSSRRVRSDAGFVYMKENIDRLAKSLATKSISLNEAERRQELAQQKAHRTEYESVVRQSNLSKPLSYEVTLENVDSPGLPAPSPTGARRSPAARFSAEQGRGVSADGATNAKANADVILDESIKILDDYVDLLGTRADKASLRRAAR